MTSGRVHFKNTDCCIQVSGFVHTLTGSVLFVFRLRVDVTGLHPERLVMFSEFFKTHNVGCRMWPRGTRWMLLYCAGLTLLAG